MNEYHYILLILLTATTVGLAKDILGCGGFVKSHVPIDFSKVEVKLLTKQGILRDKINCAPNNGYYFIPLYDKGEYILELNPLPGWSFTPTRVNLVVDGETDLCTLQKDIDFTFNGFGITGKVESLGNDNGPSGVEVQLVTKSDVRTTITGDNGNFFFTPVYPGTHTVKIRSNKWKSWKESVSVVVAEGNTELPPRSLIIQGYNVIGSVKNKGEPIKDLVIVLFATSKGQVEVDGCNKSPIVSPKGGQNPICHVVTDQNGVFKFSTVPYGKYTVAPYYSGQNMFYQPNSIEFSVEHNDVTLKQSFEIIGLSISGRVLDSPNGKPMENAKVFVNGQEVVHTNKQGVYELKKLEVGVYNLKAAKDDFRFEEVSLKITPNSKQLPDLIPTAYKVCGSVLSDKSQTVTFTQIGSTKHIASSSAAGTGKFCEFLTPGKYQIQVVVNADDSQNGLRFFPNEHVVEVNNNVPQNILFSQLKATVQGKIQCLDKQCPHLKHLKAILKAKVPGDNNSDELVVDVIGESYEVSEVYPGVYEVRLSDNHYCWRTDKQVVNVNNVKVEVSPFVQTGFSITFQSSHDTHLVYQLPGQAERAIEIPKGKSSHCLDRSGSYKFNLKSCHSYSFPSIDFHTNSSQTEPILLKALKNTVTIKIESPEGNYWDGKLSLNGELQQIKNLKFANDGYELEFLLAPGESGVIVPKSNRLFFNPPIVSITGANDCVHLGTQFRAVVGVVFTGKIVPPLAGVLVTVETENFESLMTETDTKGVYTFPPLDKTKSYKLAASKDSYVLVGPNDDGDFLAHKLAEIAIEVLDKSSRTPLQGALLSLSGGDGYRSNLQTDENGTITFHSLSPGDYFLRPMMKEYNFEPSSRIVKVNEGETVNIQLKGTRIAFSAYGKVTSLNLEPEENVIIVATGLGNCTSYLEESTSEVTGQFRIRGLQPYCSYEVAVRSGALKTPIERGAPARIVVPQITSDIYDLKIVVFRPVAHLDLLVKVYARNPEHYKTFKLKVVKEKSGSAVYTSRIDAASLTTGDNVGILVQVPPIPVDGQEYLVVLESSLNNKLEPEPKNFKADSVFKYVQLNFDVRHTNVEQDIKETSVWTLFVIFGIMFAVYNLDKVSGFVWDRVGVYFQDFISSVTKKQPGNEYVVDNDDIDQIVQNINAVKRKPKPKKL